MHNIKYNIILLFFFKHSTKHDGRLHAQPTKHIYTQTTRKKLSKNITKVLKNKVSHTKQIYHA